MCNLKTLNSQFSTTEPILDVLSDLHSLRQLQQIPNDNHFDEVELLPRPCHLIECYFELPFLY